MKILYLTALILSLILTGCSSIYKISDFPSKDKFYDDFNSFARNKTVKVTLTNDSSFSVNGGSAIENDTLYYLGEDVIEGNRKFALPDIEEIKYTGIDYRSAAVLLRNGESYKAKHIKISQDSIDFEFTKELVTLNNITAINNIREITYKNRWLGIPTGLSFGSISGLMIGITGIFPVYTSCGCNSNTSERNYFGSAAIGLGAGIGIGIIAGWLIGNNYTYQFNP